MGVMEIPPFSHKIEINDLHSFIRTRLSQDLVVWPGQAIRLLGYMCHPNDPEARASLMRMLRTWQEASEESPPAIPPKLNRIQYNWIRVADILHLYSDLIAGHHQDRRGGPSIGKAISLLEANAKSRGTGAANVWKLWSAYKDAAHLITAAASVCTEARTRYYQRAFEPLGLPFTQFHPFHITMLMPDFVIAVALDFERLGLSKVPHSREEPTLDPEALWRIPPDINVVPVTLPVRRIRPQDLMILNQRRAGNRGKTRKGEDSSALGIELATSGTVRPDDNESRGDRTESIMLPGLVRSKPIQTVF